uniref:KIB1-4 beta-propeller domain-containing protein n=1 Tax=Oryza brachyantha TaxID=4533 RepID=J3ND17_ORYBR
MDDEFPPPCPPHPPPPDDGEAALASLPADLVREYLGCVRCNIDRHRAGTRGETWRAQIRMLEPLPPPLPLLLVPRSDGPPVFHCVLSNWRTHPYFVRERAHAARFYGSYDGSWLFVSLRQNDQHFLLNLERPHVRINLPNTHLRSSLVPPFHFRPKVVEDRIVIVAATFTRQPTEQGCVAAGIIGYPPCCPAEDKWHVAFWGMGNGEPVISQSFPPTNEDLEVEDLLYSPGPEMFRFLTRGEHIREFHQPIFPLCDMDTQVQYFQRRGRDDDRPVLARYLVKSRGKLLMVVRLGTREPPSPTMAFRLFQPKVRIITNAQGKVDAEHHWAELRALDGRILFVGRGCSRSYDVAQRYPFMEGIYFLDDRSFHDHRIAFRNRARRRYHCNDVGKWSGTPPQVRQCISEYGPSNESSPVWVIP